MLKLVALTTLALTGAVLAVSEPAFSAGGMRGMAGGRIGLPFAFTRPTPSGFARHRVVQPPTSKARSFARAAPESGQIRADRA